MCFPQAQLDNWKLPGLAELIKLKSNIGEVQWEWAERHCENIVRRGYWRHHQTEDSLPSLQNTNDCLARSVMGCYCDENQDQSV
jgi:hypothetical protein